MPLLNSEYIGTWYIVNLDNKRRLLESWSESKIQEVQAKRYIQGDIGTHIVDVGGYYYQANFSSPIVIFNGGNFSDCLDLVLENLSIIQEPIADVTILNYILDNASISINQSSVNVTASIENTAGFDYFGNYKEYAPSDDFVGRTARFYDCVFTYNNNSYPVIDARIDIKVENSKNYFVPSALNTASLVPTYGINGYSATGTVTFAITPSQFEALKISADQSPGNFVTTTGGVELTVLNQNGNRVLSLGDFIFQPRVELDMKSNQIITGKVSFQTMFRRSSTIQI
jgi:hypothetical protein